MNLEQTITWHLACGTDDIPANGGACALIEGEKLLFIISHAVMNGMQRKIFAHIVNKWHFRGE